MAASPQPNPPHRQGGSDHASPFSVFKERYAGDHGFILRTRSLEESSQHDRELPRVGERVDHEFTKSAAVALHSSFDATMSNDRSESPFRSDDDDEEKGRRASWYEDLGELSGKKHTLPHLETVEQNLPDTVRKQARRVSTVSKTPARPRLRPPGAMKKSANITPSSAAKRRRAHWQVHDSPTSRVPPTPFQGQITSPPTTTVKLDGSIFGKGLSESPFSPSPPTLTPNRQIGLYGTGKSMSKYTGTTASTTVLETTVESSDSVDTSSPTTTRFRFTTFPASLPRVNNPRSREYHDSLRKRMSFGEPASCDANQSRDDDGTQNTSISSLSADGHHHMAPVPGALPPTILDLHPPHHDSEDADSIRPIHAKLFAEDEDFGYSDDDDSQSSPARDIVGRTRLNFNLSPDKVGFATREAEATVDLMQTYDQRRINSFPSSLSSSTHMNSISACEVLGGSTTPTRRLSDKYLPTLTPREVQVHFPLEDECSPIPGFKEDPTRCEIHESLATPSDYSEPLGGQTLLSMQTVMETGDSCTNMDSVVKEESSTSSGSTNGKSRGLRPMPDISAFETNAPSSRGERSSDDSATSDSKGISSTHRLTCPPTPVRTPAWANEGGGHAFFGRQSSLITTKVLLSVPSQVLEGRCSLENSFLDDDSSASNTGCFAISGQKKTRLDNENSQIVLGGLAAPSLSAPLHQEPESAVKVPKLQDPPRLMRRVPPGQEIDSIVSFSHDFEILGLLGRGAFADVYKVRSVRDDRLYAVKRNRRQFRGKRDRDMALTEVQAMQRLQRVCGEVSTSTSQDKGSYSLYLLFFYRAWQEDGYLLCQTELCSRDTCRELIDSLRLFWNNTKIKYPSLNIYYPNSQLGSIEESPARSVPNDTVWKICHDIAAGLSHIHSHGMVHHDIKPSNIFFVAHPRFGAMCKIGDFGMAGDIGTSADGLEGDARYMSPELLSLGARQPSSDIFSLGLTIYEIAADIQTEMPSEGPEWHFLRSLHGPILPKERGQELLKLVQLMTYPRESERPTAEDILKREDVLAAGKRCDRFLQDYLHDIEVFDQKEEERLAMDCQEDQTPRNGSHRVAMPVRSPSLSMLISNPPNLLSPVGKCLH